MHRRFPHEHGGRRLRWLLTLLIPTLIGTLSARPAEAHKGGLFQPVVKDLVIENSETPGERTVWLRIADADSGSPANGLQASLIAAGVTAPLPEVAGGYYTGGVRLLAGATSLTVDLRTRPGGVSIRPLTKSWNVEVPPPGTRKVVTGEGQAAGLEAAHHSPENAARIAAAERGKNLSVRLEVMEDTTLVSPLWLRINAFVEDRTTRRLDPTEYEVFGWAEDAAGNKAEFARFSPLDAVDPKFKPGTYGGVVILPHGGAWALKADVLMLRRDEDEAPPHVVTGEVAIERQGAAPPAGVANPGGPSPTAAVPRRQASESLDVTRRTSADVPALIVQIVHSLAAGLWGLLMVAFLVLAFQRARALSTWGRNIMEQQLDTLARAAWVCTAVVYGTGIWNIYKEAPYGMPGSWSELRDFMDLPFGRAYYLSLGGKLLAYAILLYCGARLIRSAKAETHAAANGHRRVRATATRNPWMKGPVEGASAPLAGATEGPWMTAPSLTGTVTVVLSPEPSGSLAPAAPSTDHRSRFHLVLIPIMAVCGLALFVCVAILKYAHLLIEVARLSS